jgi:hypothetical protein
MDRVKWNGHRQRNKDGSAMKNKREKEEKSRQRMGKLQ